jgi:hypothetical protein
MSTGPMELDIDAMIIGGHNDCKKILEDRMIMLIAARRADYLLHGAYDHGEIGIAVARA